MITTKHLPLVAMLCVATLAGTLQRPQVALPFFSAPDGGRNPPPKSPSSEASPYT